LLEQNMQRVLFWGLGLPFVSSTYTYMQPMQG
jgi:hypothetical protein